MTQQEFFELNFRKLSTLFENAFGPVRRYYPNDFIKKLGVSGFVERPIDKNTNKSSIPIGAVNLDSSNNWTLSRLRFYVSIKYNDNFWVKYELKTGRTYVSLDKITICPEKDKMVKEFPKVKSRISDKMSEETVVSYEKTIDKKEKQLTVYDFIENQYPMIKLNLSVLFFDVDQILSSDEFYDIYDSYKLVYDPMFYKMSTFGNIVAKFSESIRDRKTMMEDLAIYLRIKFRQIPKWSIAEVNKILYDDCEVVDKYVNDPTATLPKDFIQNIEAVKNKFDQLREISNYIHDKMCLEQRNIALMIDDISDKYKINNVNLRKLLEDSIKFSNPNISIPFLL